MSTDQSMREPQAAYQEVLDAVRVAWREVLPRRTADDHRSWADTGGDSLDVLKLVAHLEIMLDRPLPPEIVDMEMTPVTLADRIMRTGGVNDGGAVNPGPG